MKKYLALAAVLLLLVLGLVLLLRPGEEPTPSSAPETTAAPVTTTAETAPPTTEAPPPPPVGLMAVEGLEIGEYDGIFGLRCCGGKGWVLLQGWDEHSDKVRYRLAELDPQTAALAGLTELAIPSVELGYSDFSVTETEILLIDEYGERCAVFDRSGTFLTCRDYPTMSQENLGWQNRLLNDSSFWKESGLASFTEDAASPFSHVVAFYDETDRVHALEASYDAVETQAGHRLLTREHRDDESTAYTLLDLNRGLCLGETVFRPEDLAGANWVNPCGSVIGEGWVLLAVEWSGESSNQRRILFWYPDPADETPLQEEVWTEQGLKDRIAALTAELEPLGLRFNLNEAPRPDQTPTLGLNVSESVCDLGASLFGQYRILFKLKKFTEKLPEGFIREIHSQMPGENTDRDALHIFIVRKIPGDAAGFANAWSEPMMICFATEEFNDTHLAHEFMHVIDYRLNAYYSTERRSMDERWWALSPQWAYDEDEWLDEEQSAEVMDYFVSSYARTNSNEDRAETFQRLFDSTGPLAEEYWYAEKPKVQAKVDCLIEMIREAFPSVQAVERAWWEKLPE